MNKKISLAMTTYNGEKFLREQLESIYSQTRVPDEVIVCDDNSSDGTIQILEEYRQNKGLIYYVNKPALGVNSNFYKAISLCTGDYIALSDQDDIWLPNKIETTFNKMREIDSGMPCAVSSQCIDVDASGTPFGEKTKKNDSSSYASSLLGIGLGQGCSLMMNRSLVDVVLKSKDANPNFNKIMYDAFISYSAAMLGRKYNLGNELMLYRHHANNVDAKEPGFKLLFKERAKIRYDFPQFIPDARFEQLTIIYEYHKNSIKDPRIHKLLNNISKIYYSKSYMAKYYYLMRVKEYSYMHKIHLVLNSLVSITLKKVYM